MSDKPLPTLGTRCVHKDNHSKGEGPMWEVVQVRPGEDKPIQINHANHRINYDREPESRRITNDDYHDNYKAM
mgnify:CR=1 FL=1|jgi:hypothetical protein